MQIYVIQPGDTLWNVARAYGSTVSEIVTANQLPEPDRLVVGQAIVIPIQGSYYYVAPGDSLWIIGRMFGINYLELARINNINPGEPIHVGLRLYIPPRPKTTAVSNAYIEPIGSGASEALLKETAEAAPLLTYIAPFSYHAGSDGTITPLPLMGITEIASANNNSLMMVVTNIKDGAFSGQLARNILESLAVQQLLIDNIIQEAAKVGQFSDIHFDFEFIPVELRRAYTSFITLATDKLHQAGYMVSVALAPKTSAGQKGQWYEAHDYGALGSVVDFVVIMTYEWGYSGGPAMAVSPIGPVEQVLQYAISEMPPEKILMGQNLYGYDWTLPFVPGSRARAVSPQTAISIARNNNVAIQYDYRAQAPYFRYRDSSGAVHEVWFEDARSIQAKFELVKKLKLRGISYWKLGFSFPQNWLLLGNSFDIVKY